MDERGAIPTHTTAKADEGTSWSAPTLSDFTDQSWDDLTDGEKRRIANHYVWTDAMPPSSFGELKGPHHQAGRSGVGPVVWRAISSGRMRQMPEWNNAGVKAHIRRHYEQFDQELKQMDEHPEWRTIEVELRAEDGEAPRIEGYAAVFDSPFEMELFGGWKSIEYVRRGAFKKTLNDGADVRALLNHNSDYVLGRTKTGTLSLREDRKGLRSEIEPPDTQWAADLITSMRRGDIDQMSFAFRVVRDRWTEDADAKLLQRELLELRLYDVSVVTFPAYPATSAYVRTALAGLGIQPDELSLAALRAQAGLPLACEDAACLASASEALRNRIPAAPAQDHATAASLRRRQLELLELSA